jgi:hypothetical protein
MWITMTYRKLSTARMHESQKKPNHQNRKKMDFLTLLFLHGFSYARFSYPPFLLEEKPFFF